MRLGIVGTGPQAHRYLEPKNGGLHITSQIRGHCEADDFSRFLSGVDGVIIATHPAGHRRLALAAIAAGKHVLVEKPLALNLEDCEAILHSAEVRGVNFDVAHVHLWATHFRPGEDPGVAHADYHTHKRDYSAWLDWGPHVLSLVAHCHPTTSAVAHGCSDEEWLLEHVDVSRVPETTPRRVHACGYDWDYDSREQSTKTPMSLMVSSFVRGLTHNLKLNRRVYRALFAGEKTHG